MNGWTQTASCAAAAGSAVAVTDCTANAAPAAAARIDRDYDRCRKHGRTDGRTGADGRTMG